MIAKGYPGQPLSRRMKDHILLLVAMMAVFFLTMIFSGATSMATGSVVSQTGVPFIARSLDMDGYAEIWIDLNHKPGQDTTGFNTVVVSLEGFSYYVLGNRQDNMIVLQIPQGIIASKIILKTTGKDGQRQEHELLLTSEDKSDQQESQDDPKAVCAAGNAGAGCSRSASDLSTPISQGAAQDSPVTGDIKGSSTATRLGNSSTYATDAENDLSGRLQSDEIKQTANISSTDAEDVLGMFHVRPIQGSQFRQGEPISIMVLPGADHIAAKNKLYAQISWSGSGMRQELHDRQSNNVFETDYYTFLDTGRYDIEIFEEDPITGKKVLVTTWFTVGDQATADGQQNPDADPGKNIQAGWDDSYGWEDSVVIRYGGQSYAANARIKGGQEMQNDVLLYKSLNWLNEKDRAENLDRFRKKIYNSSKRLKSLELSDLTGNIKKIEFIDISFDGTMELGVADLSLEGYAQSYAIDPEQMNFSYATVTITAQGTELYKCKDWNFSAQECGGEWTLFKQGLQPGEDYTFTLTPEDPAFAEMRIQQCWAEDGTSQSAGTWNTACDTAYPYSALFDDDASYETHSMQVSGKKYYWGGLRISAANASVTDCDSIESVQFCYKWWSSLSTITSCDISVDANGGTSYYPVTTSCPGTTPEAGSITCVNVTSNEPWQCSNFFGTGATGAMAKSEAVPTGGANGYHTLTWDAFYFNVSYKADYPPVWSQNSTKIVSVFSQNTPSYFNISWQDDSSVSTVYFDSNFSYPSGHNYSMDNPAGIIYNFSSILPAGTFYWRSYASDSGGKWASSPTWLFSIQKADPVLMISADPSWEVGYGTQTNISCTADNDEVTPGLYRDGSYMGGSYDLGTLGAGTYLYICNNTQTQNYTSSSVAGMLNVTKAQSEVRLYINGTRSDRTIQNNTNANITAILSAGQGNISITKDGATLYDGTSPGVVISLFDSVGDYNITAHYEGNQNYTGSHEMWWINVTAESPPDFPPIWLNNRTDIPLAYIPGYPSQFNITWQDDKSVSSVFIEHNFSGTGMQKYPMANPSGNTYAYSQVLAAGTYQWRSYANDSAGNWTFSDTWEFTIEKADPGIMLLADPSWSETYGTETNVTCTITSTESSPVLYRQTTALGSLSDVQTLDAGSYDYVCNATATQNYTADTASSTLSVAKAQGNIMLYLDGLEADASVEVNSYVNISAQLATGTGNIAIYLDGGLLYNSSSPYENLQLFEETGIYNITASYEGNVNFLSDKETLWVTVNPPPPMSVYLPIQSCAAEDAAITQDSFPSACDNTYPGTALFYSDAVREVHRTRKQGGTYYWAGLRTSSSDSAIGGCDSIDSVKFCYSWWSVTTALSGCYISVDANNGASYTSVLSSCPTTTPNAITCIDVTQSESWSCGSFFGTGATGAMAKSEMVYSGGANGYYDITWDVFYFNVTYNPKVDSTVPNVTISEPTPGKLINTSEEINITAYVTDDIAVDKVWAFVTLPNLDVNRINLTTAGAGIYKASFINTTQIGRYDVVVMANDTVGKINDSETTWFNVTYSAKGAIYCTASPCIADSSLIRSVDNAAGTQEPNQPNTIDTCSDGSSGTYMSDESLENISMRSLNGTEFRGGDMVEVNITAYCYDSTSDNINFIYANNSLALSWSVKAYLDPCPAAGFHTVSRTFTIDRNTGVHAFRGAILYNGAATTTCGTSGYDDHDDLEFLVFSPREKIPPSVNLTYPEPGRKIIANTSILISANVSDETAVTKVLANISWNNSQYHELIELISSGGNNYSAWYSNTSFGGTYEIKIIANDTFGNINDTETTWFSTYHESYESYYGNASGQLMLGKGTSIFRSMSSGTVKNIFAADNDSDFAFSDLQAIGRGKDGSMTSDDFAEIDSLLYMTGHTDSAQSLWGIDSSTPRETLAFEIFGRVVANVPIVNSTDNNSIFKTGILWDTADSLDNEFDLAEAEDLIFVVAYDEGKAGTYGTYGYELRVPADLDKYKGAEERIRFFVDVR